VLRSVSKVPPGAFLVFDGQGTTITTYWKLVLGAPIAIAEEDAAAEIQRLLRDAVRMRLMSEVPLGAFLSGGVDSSAIVAHMAQLMPSPVKTFSIGFDEPEYNELPHAARIAELFHTDHHAEIVRPDVVAVLPQLIRAFDEPFADESMLPTFYLAKLARQHVTVVLSGDGGDETFGGYWRYIVALRDAQRSGVPIPLRPWLARLVAHLPEGTRGKTRVHSLTLPPDVRYVDSSSIFPARTRSRLYAPDLRQALIGADAYQVQLSRFAETVGHAFLSRMQYVDMNTYLADDILVKVDRASMWTSLETRAPFLDHRLVEFALSLPSSYLVRGSGKYILKRALQGVLPESILGRRKMGFGVPLEKWFRSDLRGFGADILFDGRLAGRGFVDHSFTRTLWRDHLSGRANNSRRLWALLCFELWCRAYLDTTEPSGLRTSMPAAIAAVG
jgi:asparagine synthase (glutamine-hydrolysing)